MPDWIAGHKELLTWMGLASVVLFVGSLIAIPVLVARIPADYFVRERTPGRPNSVWDNSYLAMISLILKNALGVIFLIAGVMMLVLPGQGILAILIGISLMNFPGKRALELKIARQPPVYRTINWIREKANRPPLQLPPKP